MQVRIRLFSDIKKFLPQGSAGDAFELSLEGTASVGELKNKLGIPDQKKCVVTVNDTNRKEDYFLADGDLVKIFPSAMGG
jgi:molybdopterin converting factor small subunit